MNDEGEIISLETQEVVVDEEDEVEAECKVIGVLGSMGEYNTMKLEGKLQNIDVVVLVDSGASHNFISSKLATALELPITHMAARRIKLGDGHKVLSQGVCKGVKVNLGSMEVSVDALVLELGGLDVILGVSWLCTLGKVMMDWKALTMQFWHDGKSITLQGQGKNAVEHCYLNSFLEGSQEGLNRDWWIPQN
ncbi:unnamed protein product [Trifolium pratense]|uniref:Uncharacterized protein n=1 Tax=Trifolium pratense TaxID=57577 RepID=A0ACB0KXH5_TRIPR|nr:unnamed protein product [Trifolium pratense]